MDRIELTRVARIVWPYIALWLVVAGGLVGFAAYEIHHHHEAQLAAGRAEADNLSRVTGEHMAQVLDGIDRTLTLFKVAHERRLAPQPMAALAEAMKPQQGSAVERRVIRFDRDGMFVASTDPEVDARGVSIADRSYFAQAQIRPDLPLYIGEAVFGRVSKATVIPVAKRLATSEGAFDGLVVSALDPQRVVAVFRALRTGERSSVGIAHRDGPVLAWAQAGSATRMAAGPSSIGEVVQSQHIIALSAVGGTELMAFASLSEDEVLASHWRFMFATLAFMLVTLAAITLPIVLVGQRAWQEVHRRRVLELHFASAYHQARTDPLTGLANRTGFDESRRRAHDNLKHHSTPFALAFIDIDHFKRLNDTLGHDVGDQALRCVAETLMGCVRQNDAVGRLGGDEFAVLMPGVTGATMHRRFEPIKIDLNAMAAHNGWSISFSIGVVACESPTPRARDAINLADRMMYDAKDAGRNAIRYAVFRDGRLVPANDDDAANVA